MKPTERRKSIRHVYNLRVQWRILGSRDYSYVPGTAQDISTSGLGLIFSALCNPGTLLIVQPEGVAEKFAEPILLRVEQATQMNDKTWKVGCSFSTPFSEKDLAELLESAEKCAMAPAPSSLPVASAGPAKSRDTFPEGSVRERRRAVRREGLAVAAVVSRGEGKCFNVEASVVSRSLAGLGLLVPTPFPRGTFLTVRLRGVREGALSVNLQVRHCRQQGNKWHLGCHFTQTPPTHVLMLLE
jgi:hypothetical protein